MIRGTTPTLTFNVNFDTALITTVYITLDGTVTLEKTGTDVTTTRTSATQGTLAVTLTQDETLAFGTTKVFIQIRALLSDGSAIASNIMETNMTKVLKEGVIS